MAATQNKHGPLSGRRILVCRPEPEASRLTASLEAAGAEARALPLLERAALPDSPEQRTLIQSLDQFHHIIAVSPYAARLLLELLDTWWPQPPMGIHWYGVGAGTASVLSEAGLATSWPEGGVDSEALLAMPSLNQVDGERVLLVRGETGRELIHDTLRQRGADVSILPLYRRQCPPQAKQQLPRLLASFEPDAVVVLSGETLNNFIALGQNSDHTLNQRLMVVPALRIAEQAANQGFRNTCVPDTLTDQGIIAAVAEYFAANPGELPPHGPDKPSK
ncbi:uroporphyrinogen-III synthase [Marinobacter zhejiangensis]|uniref:Uroporphyrinogen-III synthase n=1 Tax=Marinobacter zhejiangensis TaxID=488535 RepID=A0A1I4ME80_9GAMM|nr:uroporphyrinogen-III synthase [Marinobacter zhejiangensis]SFM01257.1 uroporphyrinogen-III synthase [Marinobacter zhejiangensis]